MRALADTSVFIAWESGRPIDHARVPAELAVSIVTVGELRAGVLAATSSSDRAGRLDSLNSAAQLGPLPIDVAVAEAWADLRAALRETGRTMPVNDSWIAATAIAHGIPVVTQDDDYADVPGLEVILV